jgi:transposase-like protein
MTKGNSGNRFSTEVRARAVRLVLENEADYKTRSMANKTARIVWAVLTGNEPYTPHTG